MQSRSTVLLATLALSSFAAAQSLPLPAPAPSATAGGLVVSPTPQSAPTVVPPVVIQVPTPGPSPVGTGPVRRQTEPTATPAATASRAAVAGIPVGGLTDAVALAKLRAKLQPKTREQLRLTVGEYQYIFRRDEFGATIPYETLLKSAQMHGTNVALRYDMDDKVATAALRELDGQVREDFEKVGLNVGGTLSRVRAALNASKTDVEAAVIAVQPPKENQADIEAAAKPVPSATSKNFPYLLAEFSTRYDASLRGRTTNLRMAARHISGTIVQPGDVFSTNQAIGPRDAAAGWKEAKMFVSGQVVSGTGSGICQAASTLYNATLLADLPIVERHPHSMRVTYVPPSRDAALMWGSKDFKFRNNTGGAVMVETFVSGGKFHARLWGQQPHTGGPVKVESHVLSRSNGATRSEAYKIVEGKRIRLSRDSYAPHP